MPGDRQHDVTVVIPVLNARRTLARALRAVAGQHYPPGRVRVLVVDNGSTDGSRELAERTGARVITARRRGVVFARETGWRAARTDLVAFLDADCEPPSDWLARAADDLLRADDIGAVGVRLVDAEPRTLAEQHIAASRILDTDFFWAGSWLHFPFVVTAGVVVRRAALESIDGFDLSFGRATGEDADMCWRMAEAGWRILYARRVEVRHYHRATIRQMLRQVYWYGSGATEVFARHQARFGHPHYVDPAPYGRLAQGIVRAPGALLRGRGRYEKLRPALEALDAAVFIFAKLWTAVKRRVLFA